MKLVFGFLIFLTFEVQSSSGESALNTINSLMEGIKSGNQDKISRVTHEYFKFSNVINDLVSENAGVDAYFCDYSHVSKRFYGVVCHVTYNQHRSGNIWLFYVLSEESGGKINNVVTNMHFSDYLSGRQDCVYIKKFKDGLSGDVVLDNVSCDYKP